MSTSGKVQMLAAILVASYIAFLAFDGKAAACLFVLGNFAMLLTEEIVNAINRKK